jgi:hypothetical protein
MFGMEKTLKYKDTIYQTIGLLFIEMNREELTDKQKQKVLKDNGFEKQDIEFLMKEYSY